MVEGEAGFVEGVAAVVLGFEGEGRLVVLILVELVEHVLPLFGNHEAVLLLVTRLGLHNATAVCRLQLLLFLETGLLFGEVIKALDELLGEEGLVFEEAVALRPEGCALDVLDFELDGSGGDGGDADVEVCLHKIII